jgi:hypothetical protein
MKRNVLFLVIDSVTNDVAFNKSKDIMPFLYKLRKKSISGDKMFSEAPFTEAALVSLLASRDTMDDGGYMEKFKNFTCVNKIFKDNGYKTFFANFYPSIYPSYMINGVEEKKYIEGFQFSHVWEYRFEYYADLYLNNETNESENNMLVDMMQDNFKWWKIYLENIKNNDAETDMLNECIDKSNISNDIEKLNKEIAKFRKNKVKYLKELFTKKDNHDLFKIKTYYMTDKIRNDYFRNQIIEKYSDVFKRIKKLNFRKNLFNNKYPFLKTMNCFFKKDFKTVKGLIAAYKNSIVDKDIFDRINEKYDTFKVQRSFRTVAEEFIDFASKNKDKPWMAYVHVDDAHFPENFFSYDLTDMNVIDNEFKAINQYLDKLPKNYCGSITCDLSLLYCDSIVKYIFDWMDKNKLLDNTDIVITADHGFSYYFCPIREKYVISNYRENYNVPFIIYGKNIKPIFISDFCATKDLPATLLDMENIKIPNYFKGISLLNGKGRDYALLEYMGGGCPDIQRRPINMGIRTDNYFVAMNVFINKDFKESEIVEIYDLKKDPKENNNLKNQKGIINKVKYEISLMEKRYNEIKKQRRYKNDKS